MAAIQPKAAQVYRTLLRTAGSVFKGDALVLSAARETIRGSFESSRHVTDPQQQQALLADGLEAAEFLRTQVVQAAINDRGNYEVAIATEHLGSLVEPVQDVKLPRQKKSIPKPPGQ